MSDYRRANYREDPRLNRQNSGGSPKQNPTPNKTSSNGQAQPENWNSQTASYNHTQALQSAYQSLPYHNTTGHQYPTQTYYTGYQNYSYNPYENYQATQQAAYLSSTTEPRPPGDEYPHSSWTSSNNYNAVNEPPPSQTSQDYNNASVSDSDKKKTDAVAEEKIKQLTSLIKERETYEDRVNSLKKKLKLLIEQKDSLSSKRSPDKDTLRIIKENTKLQMEIQSKIKDATNVIEILSNLIGDKKKPPKVDELKSDKHASAKDESMHTNTDKVNLKHYDPEIHWCRMCDVFPQSAKELLLHLHSKAHQETTQEEIPWHKLPPEPKFPTHEGAAVKRVPIKGLQFFVASTAWYCRLCDTWIGDLHCASQHLMSITHSQNYTNFVEQNPHWEIEWMKDREKAVERVKRTKVGESDSEERKRRKRREKYSPSSVLDKEKKKKKRSKRRKRHSSDDSSTSSSSSSSSDDDKMDTSKSIRVAMRNKMKMLESDSKLDLIEKIVGKQSSKDAKHNDLPDDKLMSQWMNVSEPADKDKQLLDNLKEKLKQKHDAEKAKFAYEAEITRRQKERDEQERQKREREAQEMLAKEEEKKHREKMSMKLKDVKIKQDSYRRRSGSRSPDRRRRRSRSSSSTRRMHRNGHGSYDRSPQGRYDNRDRRDSRSRDRDRNRNRDRSRKSRSRSKSRDRDHSEDNSKHDKKGQLNKRLPFIGRMPLFKSMKVKNKNDDDPPKREIQKEGYDEPRKTRFQPGNLARSFIPNPEVVCFPQLSSYPPCPPPPPPITVVAPPVVQKAEPPEPPKISGPKPPPPPKLDVAIEAIAMAIAMDESKVETKEERALKEAAREEAQEQEESADEKEEEMHDAMMLIETEPVPVEDHTKSEDYMLYEDTSNSMYQYGNIDYNMIYPPAAPPAYNFMQVSATEPVESELPKSHTMPLEPPPLPPDDPNEDLAMLGLSSDDMAVQQMY